MGALFVDGIEVGDDGRLSGRTFGADPDAAGRRERDRAAMAAAARALDEAGRRAAIILAKNAARRYRRRPAYLDAIAYGLSFSHPEMMIARVREESRKALGLRRDKAEIVPVVAVNHQGAIIYARWLRRFEGRANYLMAAE